MSFDFQVNERFTTNNGLILQVTDNQGAAVTTHLDSEDFVFAYAVGRVSGDNSDLPRNVFVFRASDGRRFRQQAEDSGLNIQGAYVAPAAPAPAVTAQAVTATSASAWQVSAPVTTHVSAGPIPPANAPSVGDRAETRLGLVLEVTAVDFVADGDFGNWVVSSRAVGRTENTNATNRGRPLPRNVFHHSLAGYRIDDVRDASLTQIVRGLDPDAPIAFDEDLTAVDEQPAVPASAVLGDNLPR